MNLLDRLLPIVQQAGYDVEVQDNRNVWSFEFEEIEQTKYEDIAWPKGHPAEGEPIILRDYQVDVINNFLKNPQSLQEVATGVRKTSHNSPSKRFV